MKKLSELSTSLLNRLKHDKMGYTASELEKILKIKVDDVLFGLVKDQKIEREKFSGRYVYYSRRHQIRKQQELFRKDTVEKYSKPMESDILMNELKAIMDGLFQTSS